MIYLVSNSIDTSGMEGVEPMGVEESLKLIGSWPVVQFDSETTGLDPHVNKVTSLQFGYKDYSSGECTQVVVDCRDHSPEKYRKILEGSYLIGHNLKFDIEFLYNYRIIPRRIYDTMICEQVLYLGYPPGRVSYSLGHVAERYLGIELDKSFQSEIAVKGLTPQGIIYAANDVVHLQDIRQHQMAIADSRKCRGAFALENGFVTSIAYLEWCGIHLDEKKWKERLDRDIYTRDVCLNELNKYVESNTKLQPKFTSTTTEPSLFDESSVTHFPCTVLWSSPQQVVDVFKTLGFNTTTLDKKKHEERDSVQEDVLKSQKGIDDDFLKVYFNYKEASKRVSAFGQQHLNQINPNTGRLHTTYRQIGTITGRMASGSKKPNKDLARLKKLFPEDVTYCNMQQLPHEEEFRSCFTAEPGNVFVSCDYSAEESRVQADVWNEKKLLDCFANGIDTHNLYAKLFFPDELKDVDVKDVKKKHPELRQKAKSAEFAIGYGSTGYAIASRLGVSLEETKEKVANLQKEMPGMLAFKKKWGKFLKEHGYILVNEKTGHRVYWPDWSSWKAVDDTMDYSFWQEYEQLHKGTDDDVCKKVMKHRTKASEWCERKVLNVPIQGGSAIVLKQAATDLFRWIVDNGHFGVIKFCVMAHDEIDCECPETMKDTFPKVMENIMEKAAAKYYKKLPIPAECSCGSFWIH